jgi:hypothetical protein
MNTTDAIIIGEGFLGLYSGIKLAEKGYNVKIFEKKNKIFNNNIKYIFHENNYNLKKMLLKMDINLVSIELDNKYFEIINNKLELMPTKLKQETKFNETCINIVGKNITNFLQKNFYDFDYLLSLDTLKAIQSIKKHYLISKKYYIIKESFLSILKKMRIYFKSLNGQIFINNNINNISITNNNQFILSINNKQWDCNIIISTISSKNLNKIYNFEFLNENLKKINILDKKILEKYHIAIPNKKDRFNNEHNLNNIKIFNNENIYFFICHFDFCKNPYWINNLIDNINDIMKKI